MDQANVRGFTTVCGAENLFRLLVAHTMKHKIWTKIGYHDKKIRFILPWASTFYLIKCLSLYPCRVLIKFTYCSFIKEESILLSYLSLLHEKVDLWHIKELWWHHNMSIAAKMWAWYVGTTYEFRSGVENRDSWKYSLIFLYMLIWLAQHLTIIYPWGLMSLLFNNIIKITLFGNYRSSKVKYNKFFILLYIIIRV